MQSLNSTSSGFCLIQSDLLILLQAICLPKDDLANIWESVSFCQNIIKKVFLLTTNSSFFFILNHLIYITYIHIRNN